MPTLKHAMTPIQGFMPSDDQRNESRAWIIDGRNFFFDAKGPKSGFGSAVLTPFPLGSPKDVHSIVSQDRVFVFPGDSILTWRRDNPSMWEMLYGFTTEIPNQHRGPWSSIFVEGVLYFAHPYRGFFDAVLDDSTDQLLILPKTDTDIPGLIQNIRAMDVVHGRPILVNNWEIQWGAVGDVTDFTPALAGAGIQALSAFVQGTFLGYSSFQDGFIVWTTGGPVVAEFIDGDDVWQFYPLKTVERPLNSRCVARLSNGTILFLSQHGLMQSSGNGQVEALTPEFNEYFLSYIELEDGDYTQNQTWRLDYDSARQMIYVSESTNGSTYWRTFVLSPTRNKWGLFSDQHYGFLQYTRDTFGYVDVDGIPHYFTYGAARESDPDNAAGFDRHYPRHQKYGRVVSTSCVSRAYTPNDQVEMTPFDPQSAAWYPPYSEIPHVGAAIGLDSWIEIGYVRPQEIAGTVSDAIEIQEMFVSSIPSVPDFPVDFRSAHHESLLYSTTEDWNSVATIVDGDETEDLNTSLLEDIDYLTADSYSNQDYVTLNYPTISFSDDGFEDWNDDSGTEDWGGVASGLSPFTYNIEWQGSVDGITFDLTTPEMARFDIGGQIWVGLSSGVYHRIRLEAIDPMQFYHAATMNVTIQYSGKLI